uniref:MAM domain-containing protein n=1 Tax=Pectinophora gossypiella TaxID=13191 RepID=A0A1E1WDU8_PECGO
MGNNFILLFILFLNATGFGVFGEDCVTFDFEDDFDNSFSHEIGVCSSLGPSALWRVGNYSEVGIESPDPLSASFISPSNTLSCVTSFTFTMSDKGMLEVNLYMEAYALTDQIVVIVNQIVPGGNDAAIGTTFMMPLLPNYYHGWHTLTISLNGFGNIDGYISLTGAAAEGSLILLDSFRYVSLIQSKFSNW